MAVGVPAWLLRLEISFYRGRRFFFTLEGLVVTTGFASFGLPAGSRFADIMVAAYTMQAFDNFCKMVPE
eukprot:9563461-Prorocentrum_lima.AAC.1